MSISDSDYLLQRVPELQSLANDPKIRRAIETGDPFKVYRALLMARLLRRLPKQQDLLIMLTGERRLFAKPMTATPSSTTSASAWFRLIGASEHDTDDSYVAMRALVIFSSIPLIPLGSYVVKSIGKRQWQIYARVPMDIKGWLYTRGLALGVAILVLSGAFYSYHQRHSQEVILLNGFDLPVLATLDGETIKLPAQGKASMTVRTGAITGFASVDKIGVIDDFQHTIVSTDGTTVWNIAGAAPLLHTTIVSSKVDEDNPDKGAPSVYCGTRFIELDTKLSVNKITLAKTTAENGPVGIAMCVKYANENAQEKTILPALEALALIYDWSLSHTDNAIAAAKNISLAESIRVAKRAMQAKPGQIAYERRYQDIRDEAGEHDALLLEYAERAKQQPASASAQFLYASLLSGPAGVNAMQELSRQFPENADILHSLVWRKAIHYDYAGANQDLARLRKLSPSHADSLLDTEVKTLMAERRGIEALRLLHAAVRDKTADKRSDHAADFALVAKQINVNPDFWLKELPAAEKNAEMLDFYRVRAGLRPLQTQDTQSSFVKLALALRNDPDQARKIAKGMNRNQLSKLATDQLSLLLGEVIRTQDTELAGMMNGMLALSRSKTKLLEEFIRGEAVSLDQMDIDLEIQSAACFIRSRNPQLSAQERSSLRSRAAKTDLLPGPITTALHQWPL
ncbi:MAG: hypothetical protein Q7T62_16350 [Undibacterium sp.]|nr:hypothetical protein [Undibacterium sp.]